MSACTGITECDAREYCDLHFKEEVIFIATYFCADSPAIAAARQQQVEVLRQLEQAQRQEDIQCLDL